MAEYGDGQQYIPVNEQEEIEKEENRKYQVWQEGEDAKKAAEEQKIKQAEEAAAAPQTTDKAVKGGKGDHSWGGHEDKKKAKESTTDKAVKGGEGDHSWGGHEDQKKQQYGLEKPANVSQEDWDNRPEWSRGLENVVAAGATPALGVMDFVADTAGLVPWLKPLDEWWDDNSPRSNHPAHKVTRDAASIIIPTMWGGGAITGSLKTATAARSIPQAQRVLGTIAAHAGVDTAVTAISSHSKEQDNIARTLNDWLGWDIPWATRDTDSPDVIRQKNIYESAGLSVGVDLIQAAFSLGKVAKVIPADEAAEMAMARHATGFEGEDPISKAVLSRQASRTNATRTETLERLMKDPEGKRYDAFINEPSPGPNWRAVTDLEPDPIRAKVDNYRIQNNIGTTNGRTRPVVDSAFMKTLTRVGNDVRAGKLKQLFDENIGARVGAVIKGNKVKPKQINRAVTKLYDQVFDPDISLSNMEKIIDDMKGNVYQHEAFMNPEEWKIVKEAFEDAFTDIYDPTVMRASAMVTNQAGGTIADTSTAINMIGDIADTGRQHEIILDKLQFLSNEVKINKYIANKADEYKRMATQNPAVIQQWLLDQKGAFNRGVSKAILESNRTFDILHEMAKNNPIYLKPLAEAMEATGGEVDQIYKLHRYMENRIGLVKKAFYDAEPEIPSAVVQGLNSVRYNHVLSGLAPLRAMAGNMMLTGLKPASVLVGAKLTGDADTFRKALWTYGGFTENIKRAYKVMGDEWRLAKTKPEEAMMRGRADLRQSKMNDYDALESMAEVWRREGNTGKVALWNLSKGLTWYNNNPFVRWGTNAMYAIDGFTGSMMASGSARSKAYAQMMESNNGAFSKTAFNKLQRKLYDDAFDASGVLTDKAAKHATKEIALNVDNDLANRLNKIIERVPAAKSLFMFPRTGLNALNVAWTFTPGSSLVPVYTKARKVLSAQSIGEMTEALAEHGLEYSDEAFATLKSEYIGRQLMGGAVVTGAGLWALEGNLTGNGPHSAGERKRMQDMGAKFNSIKNPITGEWHSYKGFEPFDTMLGLVGDIVYYSNRLDQSFTDQMYQKLAFSISMNIANKTFLNGFEPLVSMFSGDEGAFKRFIVNQGDAMIPFAPSGMRSILNNAITPQLKDVENDWGALINNKWKFLHRSGTDEDFLQDQMDIYTGKPIRFYEPMTAAVNAFMPFGKSNGGMEPWRQWLISTGWDSQPTMERNPITGEMLSTQDRWKVNNWIAQHMNLSGQIEDMMDAPDDFWNKKLKEYKKARGWKKQSEFPIKELVVHQELNRIHREAMKFACSYLERYHEEHSAIGQQNARIKNALRRGDIPEAVKGAEYKEDLKNILGIDK